MAGYKKQQKKRQILEVIPYGTVSFQFQTGPV